MEIFNVGGKPIYAYGKFLIMQDSEGEYYIYNIEEKRMIFAPMAGSTKWTKIEITDKAVIFSAFPPRMTNIAPTSGYVRGVKSIFLKSIGGFIMHPQNDSIGLICDDIQIKGGTIWCKLDGEKTNNEYWFDMNGSLMATKISMKGDFFYTVELYNGKIIERVCEVHPVEDFDSHRIMGLHIITTKETNETETNLYHPFF